MVRSIHRLDRHFVQIDLCVGIVQCCAKSDVGNVGGVFTEPNFADGHSLPLRLLLVVMLCAPAARTLADEPEATVPAREKNFTGPLVSGGPPVPAGTLIVQPYLVQTQTIGRYDSDGKRQEVDDVADDWRAVVPVTYGITDRFTVAATLRGVHARTIDGDRRWAAGDTTLNGQYLLYKGMGAASPTFAVSVRQNMPTGRHDQLDRLGLADATGSGASFTSWVSPARPSSWPSVTCACV